MALDFQRPDPSSPAAVASAQFTPTRRGYKEDEVRDFLRQVSVEMARLLERERFLESELKATQSRGPLEAANLDEATVTALLGEEAARVLSAAREAAQAMRDRAVESAEQIVREASREAARALEEATVEAARRRTDVSSEAEQELELAKQQGREMVAEVRAYRERVLADLAKRSEEARRELERLVHERERLLGAFERARHAATDVVGDLGDFDQAIRDAGIVPPLVPPDAPPPPNPTRSTSTPIFDAMEYKDELGSAHRSDEPAPAEAAAVEETPSTSPPIVATNDPEPTIPAKESPDTIETDHSAIVDVTRRSETELLDEKTPDQGPDEMAESAPEQVPMAPVVNLLERRRRKDLKGVASAVEESTTTPPASSDVSSRRASAQAAHPVFERVEAREEAVGVGQTPSRVDAIFERLRSSSPQRVAEAATQDLADTATNQKSSITTPNKSSTTPPDKKSGPKPLKPLPVDAAVFRRRDETVQPSLEGMTRALKRGLSDDENAALTHIGTKRSILTIEAMLPAVELHASTHADSLRESVLGIAVEAARSLSGSRRSDMRSTVANDSLFNGVLILIKQSVTTPLREKIAAAINQARGDRDALMTLLRAIFVESRATIVDSAVLDVAHFAYARGLFVGCDTGRTVCWAVDPSGPSCADAEDNALAGALAHGEAFPTGHIHPLAHAGCRCVVVPTDL